MEKLKPYAFLFLAALLYGHGFPNHLGIIFAIGPIIATVILLKFILNVEKTKTRLSYYLFYNTVLNIHSFSWITGTLQEFGSLPWAAAAFLNSLYALVFNPHIWIFIFFLAALKKYKPELEIKILGSGFSRLALAALLSFLEYYTPQQFPVMLGQPWIIFGGYIYLARIFGVVGFSFISYLAVTELLSFYQNKKFSLLNTIAIVAFTGLNIGLGIQEKATLDVYQKEKDPKSYNVRLVQANISNFLKTESEKGGFFSVRSVLDRYKNLSLKPSKKPLDLIIWPETAYPYAIYTNKENILATNVPTIFQNIVFSMNAPVLFGGYDHFRDNPNGSYFKTEYNAALLINTLGQLEQTYHKHVLIPFGETLPLGPLNESISKVIPEMAFFQEGSKKPVFETENGLKFITTICYEKLRPEFLRDYLNQASKHPHVMINLTNDSWYGNTLEPELHLFLARWRSAELNMPTLRSTNTGVSVYIDRYGIERKRLEYEVTGNLDITIEGEDLVALAPTVFQKYGILSLLALMALLFIFQGILLKYKHD